MAQNSNPFQNRNTYIPPAVQKSMAAHMDRTMPAHLKQYQNSGARMPARVEQQMTAQMQKNLPSHMQQYVEPYMHQNVVYGNTDSSQGAQLRTSAPTAQSYKPVQTQVILPNNNSSRRPLRQTSSSVSSTSSFRQPQTNPSPDDDYEFILNPQKPPKKPLIDFSGASMFKRLLLVGGGLIGLIILASVLFSFLNNAGNAQKERLLEIAQTQEEIIRIADSAVEKISDRNLLYKAEGVKLIMTSSQQDTLSALSKRGVKKVGKKLSGGQNSQNDELIIEGEQNGNLDEVYQALLDKQLSNYGLQLQAAFEGSTPEEKQAMETAFNQIDLLLSEKSAETR